MPAISGEDGVHELAACCQACSCLACQACQPRSSTPALPPPPAPHPPAGLLWEVTAELASVGLSMASPTHELGYLRAGGLRTTVAVSAARFVVDLEVKSLQVRGVGGG